MGISKTNSLTSFIIALLNPDVPLFPLESAYDFAERKGLLNSRRQYRDSIKGLRQRGLLEIIKKTDGEFLKLTQKGSLRLLLEKARIPTSEPWDGKWRVLVFDIPEDFNSERNLFRKLLRQNGFIKLQASVFICPRPLSRNALNYLTEVGLIKYIRIMKVEEMDYDKDLRKKFGL